MMSTLASMTEGCDTEPGALSPTPGDLAHQLGTGELVSVAPHWPTPGASAGGHVHGGSSRTPS
jgi:hypothetical protein